jgi:hypothetical protein
LEKRQLAPVTGINKSILADLCCQSLHQEMIKVCSRIIASIRGTTELHKKQYLCMRVINVC